jgi:hypothetical protein
VSPNPVKGGTSATGTVILECAAPAGGLVVTLASANPTVANPTVANITIPAGSNRGTFTVSTKAVTATQQVSIKATGGGGTTVSTTLVVDR